MKTSLDPSASRFGAAYLVALLVIAVLDSLWLGWLAKDFYRREMGELMAESIRLAPAVVFYLLYPAGLLVLALVPVPSTLGVALARSAAVGLIAYGAYDLTNLATLREWSLKLSLIDIAWGTLASAAAGTTAWWCVLRGHVLPHKPLPAPDFARAPTRGPNGG